MKDSLDISKKIDNVAKGYYASCFRNIDKLGKEHEFNGDRKLYLSARYIIANFVWLIHERLEHKIFRDLNYQQIKSWGRQNRELVEWLLSIQFPEFELPAFKHWAIPQIGHYEVSMYSPSNRYNKNTWH